MFIRFSFFIILSAVVGLLSWGFFQTPKIMPLSFLIYPLWFHSRSRMTAWFCYYLYLLVSSRGLVSGAGNFLHSESTGVMVWFFGNLFQSLPYLLWFKNTKLRIVGLLSAIFLTTIGPFFIVGWANPLSTVGVFLEGGGLFSLFMVLMFVVFINKAPFLYSLPVILSMVMPQNRHSTIDNWVAVDTNFHQPSKGFEDDFYRQDFLINLSNKLYDKDMIVYPESVIGVWLSGNDSLWKHRKNNNSVVLVGSSIPSLKKMDNVVLLIQKNKSRVIYRQRIPVPYAMWNPFKDNMFNAYLFDKKQRITTILGKRVSFLVCYEQYLLLPMILSGLEKPDYLIGMSNLWWVNDDSSIRIIQRNLVYSLSRLFNIPYLYAENH